MKLKDSGEQIVEIVIAAEICEIGCDVGIGHPRKQAGSAGAALNIATDGVVELRIDSFELRTNGRGTVKKPWCDGLLIGEEGIE